MAVASSARYRETISVQLGLLHWIRLPSTLSAGATGNFVPWKYSVVVYLPNITLEGKKAMPNGYLNRFNLADKCFCFHRVYGLLSRQTDSSERCRRQMGRRTGRLCERVSQVRYFVHQTRHGPQCGRDPRVLQVISQKFVNAYVCQSEYLHPAP